MSAPLSWFGIVRLGLVQASLGAVVVMTTSTLNRVMVVEMALPAMLPGVLVALHYLVQLARPRMGYGSDVGHRRTPWIIGGMLLLAAGGLLAAGATILMAHQPWLGFLLAVLAFVMIGLGVSASGTSLLVLLAKRVDAPRRAGAATVVWLMMIAGFAVTAGVAGWLLDPFTPLRLIAVSGTVSVLGVLMTLLAIHRLEGAADGVTQVDGEGSKPTAASITPTASPTASAVLPVAPAPTFKQAIAQVWDEPTARRFTIFVFISMLAYSAQDLILEPFAGAVFGYTPGQSTSLSGLQHGGVLVGMIAATLAGRSKKRRPGSDNGSGGNAERHVDTEAGRAASHDGGYRFGSLAAWQIGGCLLSALMLLGLVAAGLVGPAWPFKATVFGLGVANGAFSIAAIAAMMQFSSQGRHAREGTRMGMWGAAQAVAFGMGGLVGTAASDLARWLIGTPSTAYAVVFAAEAMLFVAAAVLVARLNPRSPRSDTRTLISEVTA